MRTTAPFDLDFELDETTKAIRDEDGDVVVEGYAATFDRDREGDIFLPGAFDRAVAKAERDEIPVLFEHDNKRQLGVVEQLRTDAKGLWARARLAAPTPGSWAVDVVSKIKRGMTKGFSVHGITKVQPDPEGQYRIGDIDLTELTITPRGMQEGALFAVATKSIAAANEDDPNFDYDELATLVSAYFAERLDLIQERADRLRALRA